MTCERNGGGSARRGAVRAGARVASSHALGRGTYVVDLEYHLHQLSGQHDLLFLAMKRLNDVLLLHVCNRGKSNERGQQCGKAQMRESVSQ